MGPYNPYNMKDDRYESMKVMEEIDVAPFYSKTLDGNDKSLLSSKTPIAYPISHLTSDKSKTFPSQSPLLPLTKSLLGDSLSQYSVSSRFTASYSKPPSCSRSVSCKNDISTDIRPYPPPLMPPPPAKPDSFASGLRRNDFCIEKLFGVWAS